MFQSLLIKWPPWTPSRDLLSTSWKVSTNILRNLSMKNQCSKKLKRNLEVLRKEVDILRCSKEFLRMVQMRNQARPNKIMTWRCLRSYLRKCRTTPRLTRSSYSSSCLIKRGELESRQKISLLDWILKIFMISQAGMRIFQSINFLEE
jgi:hypothetical protein